MRRMHRHMPAHVFPLPHPPPHPRMYTYHNGSLPHPFTHPRPPHLRRSLTQRLGVLADRMTLRILIRPFTERTSCRSAWNAFLILSRIKPSQKKGTHLDTHFHHSFVFSVYWNIIVKGRSGSILRVKKLGWDRSFNAEKIYLTQLLFYFIE